MLPLKDDNPTARFPVLTLGLIMVNSAVYLIRAALPRGLDAAVVDTFAFHPVELTGASLRGILSLVTSQFLHGGLLHLGGNMLFLWIFGNNIEDHLGRARFLPFYLGCGVLAGLTQWAADPGSPIPTIGASGAIAGVLGAYAITFPRARVHTLLILFLFIRVVAIPAAVWLGLWFLVQVMSAVFTRHASGGGIAWFAHLGGFIAGLVLVRLIAPRPRRPGSSQFAGSGWIARP